MTRKKGRIIGLILLLVLVLALAAAWWLVPRMRLRAQVVRLAEADSCFDMTVYSEALELTVPAFLAGDYLGATLDGQTLYLSGENITLANGQAFTFGTAIPDLRALLRQAATLMLLAQSDDGAYTVCAQGEQAQKLLDLLPEGLLSVADGWITLTITPGDTLPESIKLELFDVTTSSSSLVLTLTPTAGTPTVPQTVLEADGEAFRLTFDEAAVPLLRAALSIAGQTRYAASAALSVGASVLNVQDSFSLCYDRSLGVGTLQSDSLTLYFSPSAVCTEGGQLVTSFEELTPGALLALALPLLTDGRVDSLRDGGDGQYSCALTSEETDSLTALVHGISTLLGGVTLTGGTVEAQVRDNALAALSFTCEGTVKVLVTVPVMLTLTLAPESFAVPQAVLDALGKAAA